MTCTTSTPRPRRLLLAAATLLLAGCGPAGGAYDLPLPGGAHVGDHPMTITVDFDDVLDLVPHASVQLDHVAVGRVRKIALSPDGKTAEVTLEVRGGLDLPADTTARLQQTSLLGEKYVALVPGGAAPAAAPGAVDSGVQPDAAAPGTGSAGGRLEDGARIDASHTSRAVGAEDVLGALSALLNGGGVGQFQTISRELQQIAGGRTDEVRAFLRDTEAMVAALDDHRAGVVGAIDGLDALATQLSANRTQLQTVLDKLGPGIANLAGQRADLTRMLAAMDRLSTTTVSTLNRAGDDMVADLKHLDPVLTGLANAGSNLPKSLQMMLTFPFTDAVMAAARGDYLNAYLHMNLAVRGARLLQPEDGR